MDGLAWSIIVLDELSSFLKGLDQRFVLIAIAYSELLVISWRDTREITSSTDKRQWTT